MGVRFNELKTELRIDSPDDFYEELIKLHEGLTEEQSMRVNAKLVLILANHIGDVSVLREALACARLTRTNS